MLIPAHIFQQAMDLYIHEAYPAGTPADVKKRMEMVRAAAREVVPLEALERDTANSSAGYALRLGQPLYPHMKLIVEPVPGGVASCAGQDFLLRVDAHDRHLHAPAGSPDEAWLAKVRQSNQELVEKIEAAWAAAGLPTFKEFLRRQLEARKKLAGRP